MHQTHDFRFDYCDLCNRAVPVSDMRPGAICARCDDELSRARAMLDAMPINTDPPRASQLAGPAPAAD